jgi:hypothetical protein
MVVCPSFFYAGLLFEPYQQQQQWEEEAEKEEYCRKQ